MNYSVWPIWRESYSIQMIAKIENKAIMPITAINAMIFPFIVYLLYMPYMLHIELKEQQMFHSRQATTHLCPVS